jgi:predicted O-methyltransferase YrrM
MKNSISQFFKNINITYDDLPYLYIPLFTVIGLIFLGWLIWGQSAVWWGILIFSTYLILATQFHLYRSGQKDLVNHQKKIQAYFSLYSMLDASHSFPYMTGWAATPELALITLEELKKHKPLQIVELGSGVSTVIASHGLQQNGKGSILSLDHDQEYAEKTREQLTKHGVEDFAQVIYSPLVPHQIEGITWHWYDLDAISLPEEIDMLLIDGPPVKTNKNARFPALPLLVDKLSEHAIIIMHDAYRHSERDILSKWQKMYPEFNCEIQDTEKGIAILRR